MELLADTKACRISVCGFKYFACNIIGQNDLACSLSTFYQPDLRHHSCDPASYVKTQRDGPEIFSEFLMTINLHLWMNITENTCCREAQEKHQPSRFLIGPNTGNSAFSSPRYRNIVPDVSKNHFGNEKQLATVLGPAYAMRTEFYFKDHAT